MSAQTPLTHSEHHPRAAEYVRIAIVLTIITAAEVAVYYVPSMRTVLLPILLVLSATKFAIVAMFYMHLKFDDRLFSGFFVFGLTCAAFLIVALITLFHFLSAPRTF